MKPYKRPMTGVCRQFPFCYPAEDHYISPDINEMDAHVLMVLDKSAMRERLLALDERSGEIFRRIVESYLESGEPLGSRSLSRILPMSLSPASVRNVMSDLEDLGLIYSPHISAGRLPTQNGLRFFVDAFMQVGDLSRRGSCLHRSAGAPFRARAAGRGAADRGEPDAVGHVARGGPGDYGQERSGSEACRICPACADEGACRAGRRT